MLFKIGDLTLHRNTNEDFYHELENAHDQPVMMVEEIQINSKTEYRSEDGVERSKKHEQNCKCIWYNHRSGEFKEEWFKSKYLIKLSDGESNLIPSNSKMDYLEILKNEIGTVVRLINHDVESDKHLKASIIEKGVKNINYRKLERENQFCAPQMTIIDIKTNDRNKDIYDKNSGIKTKAASEFLVKCRWFNISVNKYSEKYLPYQLLIKNTPVAEETLGDIKYAIKEEKYIKVPNKGLFEPIHILNNGGKIQLAAYNYVLNKEQLVDLSEILKPEVLEDFSGPKAPTIKEDESEYHYFSKEDLISSYKKIYDNHLVRFSYENLSGESSFQTIKNVEIFDLAKIEDEKNVKYLKGFEIKSEKEKYYRLDRIKFMWILNYESQ